MSMKDSLTNEQIAGLILAVKRVNDAIRDLGKEMGKMFERMKDEYPDLFVQEDEDDGNKS